MEIVERVKPGALDREVIRAALGEAYERRILSACVRRALPVKDISLETGLPLPTAYRRVNHLVEVGLLVVERSAMTADGKRYDLYRSRLRRARIEMDSEGDHVTWEPNEPVEERLASMWDSLRSQVRSQ